MLKHDSVFGLRAAAGDNLDGPADTDDNLDGLGTGNDTEAVHDGLRVKRSRTDGGSVANSTPSAF